jgi:hypothetical protein
MRISNYKLFLEEAPLRYLKNQRTIKPTKRLIVKEEDSLKVDAIHDKVDIIEDILVYLIDMSENHSIDKTPHGVQIQLEIDGLEKKNVEYRSHQVINERMLEILDEIISASNRISEEFNDNAVLCYDIEDGNLYLQVVYK